MSVQRQLDKRARNLSTWSITSIHLFFLSFSKHNQPLSFLTTLALPYLIMLSALTLITAYTAHLQDVFLMGNVPHLWKNKRWSLPFSFSSLRTYPFYDFFSNTAYWSVSWWKVGPVLSLFPPFNLPRSKLWYKYQSSHTTFHCLHVLHTLFIFSITFWPQITTIIHNIQHNTPTLFPETKKKKIHQNRNISNNTIVAIAVTIGRKEVIAVTQITAAKCPQDSTLEEKGIFS